MRKVFQLLGIFLNAIFDEKTTKPYRSIYGLEEDFNAGLISLDDYNEALNRFEHQ